MIVKYNKTEFNQAQYGPYPAQIGGIPGISGRVNDETVPVKILVPTHPVFNFPNKIGPSAWDELDAGARSVLPRAEGSEVRRSRLDDRLVPGQSRREARRLVEAKYGKGRWLYVGLGLWRQLPAGTVGAYQLLANLLSLPKAPAPRVAK